MTEESRIEKFKKIFEKNPDNALVRYSLANEYFKIKDYKNAVNELIYYLSTYSDEGSGYRLLAESYIELGETEKAIETYKKGIDAANRHGHPGMADEFIEAIEFMEE
jgi:predicted Zn-dependent protease